MSIIRRHRRNCGNYSDRFCPTGNMTLYRIAADLDKLMEYYSPGKARRRYIISGLLNGMARGVGFAIGVSVLAFLLIRILNSLNVLDLPIIGDFIADLMEYVEEARDIRKY